MLARVAAVLLVLLGVWARCTNFRTVFPAAGEVELLPSDSHYYTRFAKLQLHAFPRYQGFDPLVNHPQGAAIILPPLHALAVAAAVAIAGEDRAELGAAWVGPGLSLLELFLLALLAWTALGSGETLVLLLLWALTPALVDAGALGNADHHLHEGFLAAAVALATTAFLRTPTRRWAVVLGVLLGAGRLLAPAAFMFVPCTALALAVAAALRPVPVRPIALAGAIAAGLSLLGAALFGSPLSLEYEVLSGFHPLLAACGFAGASMVAFWQHRQRAFAVAALAIALGSGALVLAPVLHAAGHLGRADPMLALVTESEPLIFDPLWALRLLGASLALLPASTFLLVRAVRRKEVHLVAPLCIAWPLVVAAALQARFAVPLAGAAAALCASSLPLVPSGKIRRGAVAVVAATLAFALVPKPKEAMPADVALVRPTLLWMKEHLPPASADPFGQATPSYGVVATHLVGHTLPLWAERPTVATLFSQRKVHVEGNQRAWAVLAADSDGEAYRRALGTAARYVLVTPSGPFPGHEGADPARALQNRLLEDGWMSNPEDTTAHFRLVHDSAEQRARAQGGSYARLFEVVAGALLRGRIERAVGPTVAGRRYERSGHDADVRVAYPGRYEVWCRGGAIPVEVDEASVQKGMSVDVPGC